VDTSLASPSPRADAVDTTAADARLPDPARDAAGNWL